MDADLLIVNASEVVTVGHGATGPKLGPEMRKLGIIEDGAVAIKGEKLVFVGTSQQALKEVRALETIDASGKTVMPGFVDPHTHLVFAGSREYELAMKIDGKSYLEILAAGGGILSTVKATRAASLETLVDAAKTRLGRMLAHGTTTIEAKTGYGLDTETELRCLEAAKVLDGQHPIDIAPTFLGAHAIPPEYRENPEGYVSLVIDEMIPKVAEKNLARYCDVFCEEGVFSVEQSRRILEAAKEKGMRPRIHADEIVPLGGAELAAELDAASADHLAVPSDAGLKQMAEHGVCAIPLPATTYALLKHEYSDARKMIDFGVPLALATDLNPNCYTESMQFIASLGCYMMKLTPAEVISACTINAAHSLGLGDVVGSLEVGKQADVIILDVPNHEHIPYHFGVNHVEMVVKKGKVVHAVNR